MRIKIPLLFFISLFIAVSAFSQTADENLLERVEIKFSLQGEPTIEDVGFNDPKSTWKIEYQLFLSDWDALKKIGRCGVRESPTLPEYCSDTTDKKLDKRVKKLSRFIAKGKFTRKQLAVNANREIIETVNFTPEVVNIFNEASKIYNKNPVFVFFVKTKISTKNSAGKKFKKQYMTEGLHWLKIYKPDNSFDYWNLSKLSYSLTILKDENGSLFLRKGYTRFGQ